MSDPIPTVRRLAAAAADGWRRFSYKDSVAARGAVWTLVCWALIYGLAFLVLVFPEYGRLSADGASTETIDLLAPAFMAIVAGAPLISFITGAALSGGAQGFLDSLKLGGKAAVFPALALMVLAAGTMGSSSEKAGLAAAIFFWVGVFAALTGAIAGLLRWLGGRLSRRTPGNGKI
ncbi:MAG: hypothetical protein ACYC2I_07480 [Elusimicrobiales bacterium]